MLVQVGNITVSGLLIAHNKVENMSYIVNCSIRLCYWFILLIMCGLKQSHIEEAELCYANCSPYMEQ